MYHLKGIISNYFFKISTLKGLLYIKLYLKGYSIEVLNEVAEKLGRTQSYISKVEAGQLRLDLIQLGEFAKLYKKNLSYFVPK